MFEPRRCIHLDTDVKQGRFITVDDPTKSPFMLHIKAADAQEERRLIAQRTREALAAAKQRGVRLGDRARPVRAKAAAATRDAQLKPILEELWGTVLPRHCRGAYCSRITSPPAGAPPERNDGNACNEAAEARRITYPGESAI